MADATTTRPAGSKVTRFLTIGVLLGLVVLGLLGVWRQGSYLRASIPFAVVDASGTIVLEPGAGAASASGLASGDRLTALDGERFEDPFRWNARLLDDPRERVVAVEVSRDGKPLSFDVPIAVARGTSDWYFYLALVGFFFLATAILAALRPAWSALTGRYCAFAVAIFLVLALADTPAAAPLDWILFLGDRVGRLAFAPMFLLLAMSLAGIDAAGIRRRLLVWAPPLLLGLAGIAIAQGAAAGWLRDPLALWTLKDRAELILAAGLIVLAAAVLARSAALETVAYHRYRLRWAFWGSVVGFGPLVVAYLIPRGLGLATPAWAEAMAIPLIAVPPTLATALFRFRPGDLELYLRRAFAYISAAFLTLAVFQASLVLLERVGRETLNLSPWMRTGVAVLIAAFVFPGIRILTRHSIDRLVYGGRFPFRRTLLSFGRELNAELSLERLASKFQERTRETLDLAETCLLVRQDREGTFRTVVGAPQMVVPIDSPLVGRIRDVSYIVLDDVLHAPGGDRLIPLRERGLQYLFPMKVEGEVRAVLGTSQRRGGESLNTEDIELLVAVCGHAAIALESARLFAALQEKVEEVESLQRYNENIVESSRIGILVVDGDRRIRAMNRALLDMYGESREWAIGRPLNEVFPLPLVRRLAHPEGDEGTGDGIRRLYRYPLNDVKGRKLIVNVSISELASGEGEGTGQVITFDDVTEYVRLQEQLLRQDRLASIGLLAAGVAHEVNTPLTGISSYAQLLMKDLDADDPRVAVLQKIEKQTYRAANIVHSLLNFTRDGSGATEPIRVSDLVSESLSLFEPQLRGRSIRITSQVEDGLPTLRGERGKLQQVLLNLLLNARDAIGNAGEIRVAARGNAGRLALEVSDTGSGIPEEDLAKIFDPFFTTKPRGRGTGLGLSLSYTIVQEHHGEILVESRPGQGSTFTVDLPFETRGAVHG